MPYESFKVGSLIIHRLRYREGPPVVYVVLTKGSSRSFTDKKSLLKYVRWPKNLPTGIALREWLDSFNDDQQPKETEKPPGIGGFGPDIEDPSANTKMVT